MSLGVMQHAAAAAAFIRYQAVASSSRLRLSCGHAGSPWGHAYGGCRCTLRKVHAVTPTACGQLVARGSRTRVQPGNRVSTSEMLGLRFRILVRTWRVPWDTKAMGCR